MPKFQFSLRWLLALPLVVAVGCGGLLMATSWVASLAYTSALLFLLVAILAAIVRRSPTRAFWIGCCVLGWGYFVASYSDQGETTPPAIPPSLLAWSPAREDFVRVGHSLLTLILAVIGGWTARGLSRVRRRAS